MLSITYIQTQNKLLHCTKFASVNVEEWVGHTCFNPLNGGRMLNLSFANGMKWPNKPTLWYIYIYINVFASPEHLRMLVTSIVITNS